MSASTASRQLSDATGVGSYGTSASLTLAAVQRSKEWRVPSGDETSVYLKSGAPQVAGSQRIASKASVIDLAKYRPREEKLQDIFCSSQEWDGYVTEVDEGLFQAVIYPTPRGEAYGEEYVEIPMEFVDERDRGSVTVGSIFRLATGKLTTRRQNYQATKIYFRPKHAVIASVTPYPDLRELFSVE